MWVLFSLCGWPPPLRPPNNILDEGGNCLVPADRPVLARYTRWVLVRMYVKVTVRLYRWAYFLKLLTWIKTLCTSLVSPLWDIKQTPPPCLGKLSRLTSAASKVCTVSKAFSDRIMRAPNCAAKNDVPQPRKKISMHPKEVVSPSTALSPKAYFWIFNCVHSKWAQRPVCYVRFMCYSCDIGPFYFSALRLLMVAGHMFKGSLPVRTKWCTGSSLSFASSRPPNFTRHSSKIRPP